jgi:hypothetical protein
MAAAISYRAVVVTPNETILGHVKGERAKDVSLKLSFNDGSRDMTPFIQLKLSLTAPSQLHLPHDVLDIYTRFYAANITSVTISKPISSSEVRSLPLGIQGDNDFLYILHNLEGEKGGYGNNQGVVKVQIEFRSAGITHENLYHTLELKDYLDPETELPYDDDKANIRQALSTYRQLFGEIDGSNTPESGELTLYVRNEAQQVKDSWATIQDQIENLRKGSMARRFYDSKFTLNIAPTPHIQFGMHLPVEQRPDITTSSNVYIHPDLLDFTTRKAYAVIQSLEYEQELVQAVNNTPASIRFLTVRGYGNRKYVGVIDVNPDLEYRWREGDVVYASFQLDSARRISTNSWRCEVIDPLPWIKTGEVTVIAHRPTKPIPENASEEVRRQLKKEFIPGNLPAGNSDKETDEEIRTELEKQIPIAIALRLESSDTTAKREINAINLLQRAKKQEVAEVAGSQRKWVESAMLKQWGKRYLNQNQIPVSYKDILGDAAVYLQHLTDSDHELVTQYLQHVPVRDDIAIGIIQGRAGVGKTFYASSVVVAILQANDEAKVLFSASANEPVDVAARKVRELMDQHKETRDLIVLRGHSKDTEKMYLHARGELEHKIRQKYQDSVKTPEELQKLQVREEAIKAKRARDKEKAKQEREEALSKLQNYQARLNSTAARREKAEALANEILEKSRNPGGELVVDKILECIELEFDNQDVVTDDCVKDDGTLDIEKLERALDLKQGMAGLQLVRQVKQFAEAGATSLVRDRRVKEIRLGLGYVCLQAAGLTDDCNKYTNHTKWATFRTLYYRLVAEGMDNLSADDRIALDAELKTLREYVIRHSSVTCVTTSNAAAGIYSENLLVDLVILDEANTATLPQMIILTSHYEPQHVLLVGDTKQLKPVVVGPTPLKGFIPELEVSAMSYFTRPHWPVAEIFIQRRARTGIMDIPTLRYYHDNKVQYLPAADDDAVHPYTTPLIQLINEMIPDNLAESMPVIYLEVPSPRAVIDSVTKSKFNLTFASVTMHIVEGLVERKKIPPRCIAIVTPYTAQWTVYRYAQSRLTRRFPTSGYGELMVATIDSMEGGERPIVISDIVVTHESGFVDDRGRMLVNITRAKDGQVVIGCTANLYAKQNRISEPQALFDLAKADIRMICRTLAKDSPLLKHEDVQLRIRLTAENVDTINTAQRDFGQDDKGDNDTGRGNDYGGWDDSNEASDAGCNDGADGNAIKNLNPWFHYSQDRKLDETNDWGEPIHTDQATLFRKAESSDIGVGDIVNIADDAASTIAAKSVTSTHHILARSGSYSANSKELTRSHEWKCPPTFLDQKRGAFIAEFAKRKGLTFEEVIKLDSAPIPTSTLITSLNANLNKNQKKRKRIALGKYEKANEVESEDVLEFVEFMKEVDS